MGYEEGFEALNTGDYKRAVDAGAKSVSAPKILPWGQIVAYVRDLNGVDTALMPGDVVTILPAVSGG